MLKLLTLIVVVVAVVTVVLRRQRHRAWRAFARHWGLDYRRDPSGRPEVTGHVDGRPCRLVVGNQSSRTNLVGVELIELSLDGLFRAPSDLDIRPARGVDPLLLQDPGIDTGDPAFDDALRVTGDDLDRVREFLSPARREAILRLFDGTDWDSAEFRESRLLVRHRRAVSRPEIIDDAMRTLLDVSRRLEALAKPPTPR